MPLRVNYGVLTRLKRLFFVRKTVTRVLVPLFVLRGRLLSLAGEFSRGSNTLENHGPDLCFSSRLERCLRSNILIDVE